MNIINRLVIGIIFFMIAGLIVIFLSDYYYFGDDLNSPVKMKMNQIDSFVKGLLNKPANFFSIF